MYDRDDPENSDCGPLAYEYLYYQAVEDGICKPFETQISLYRQKPEYTNKYQPVFESIIRACLSGEYDYWNILTYHSFVNENEDMNSNISFVKDFASPKNQKFVKKLFTRIQNEEYLHTKDLYSVDNVILKGVHSKTPTRQQIIQDFDRKVEGRIYILASCGILNEGIDTKWANMGVPINPTKSIVKESQRIGRLVRIPDENMPPAIILIPCEVDITKYSSMDTAEQRDQMIREELSECGNFNTALNVISAFKYQYDPDLFEMCLKYPNMYAPQEIKDNLEKQGLIVEDSQGELLDNLKYVCEKERIDIDTSSFEGQNEQDILNDVAEKAEKTIEIHTQNQDEPVKYINEEATDEEPLRFFYCEDDKTYSPIVKKDKKRRIKRRTTTPPKKRPKLFDVHQHPDLEVLWKIKESSIDLNKTFSQGVLDVDINWNEKKWDENLEKVKEFMDENGKRPNSNSKNQNEKFIGCWIGTQLNNYKNIRFNMKNTKIYISWHKFMEDDKYKKYFMTEKEKWYIKLNEMKIFIDTNKRLPKNSESLWICTQKTNYKQKIYLMKYENIRKKWEEFINDPNYKEYFISSDDIWIDNLDKTIKYIVKHNKRPSPTSKNSDVKKLGNWLHNQLVKEKDNIELFVSNENIYNKWIEFKNDYKEYFISSDDIWIDNLDKTIKYIVKHNKRPSPTSKNSDVKKLGNWLHNQLVKEKDNIELFVSNENIYNKWIEFKNDYKEYFISSDDIWIDNLDKMIKFIIDKDRRPTSRSKDEYEKKLAEWYQSNIKNYNCKDIHNKRIMKYENIRKKWEEFVKIYGGYFEKYNKLKWYKKKEELKNFIDKNGRFPQRIRKSGKNRNQKNPPTMEENILSSWKKNQVNLYKYKKQIMGIDEIYNAWTEFINDPKYSKYFDTKKAKTKKDMSKPEIKAKKTEGEIKVERQQRVQSELSQLHKEYKTKNSQNLNTYFKENPEKWEEYHKISKENEESFPEEEIPRNKMIKYLENLPGKKKKIIADLGCGFAEINQHFQDNSRFEFHNFDHHADNDMVVSRDIKNTDLEDYSVDIAILSLAMWGSNCKEYLEEAYRILDTGGTLLIAEAFKRWNKELDEEGNPINKLVRLLEENNFTIIEKIENKFMFIESRKN